VCEKKKAEDYRERRGDKGAERVAAGDW